MTSTSTALVDPADEPKTFFDFLIELPNVGPSTARKVSEVFSSAREVAALEVDELVERTGVGIPQAVAVLSGLAEAEPPAEPEEASVRLPLDVPISHEEVELKKKFNTEGKDFLRPIAQLRKEQEAKRKAAKEARSKGAPKQIMYRVQIDPLSAITRIKDITPAICTTCAFDWCEASKLPPYEELDEQSQTLCRVAMKKHAEVCSGAGDSIPTVRLI